MAFLLVIKLVMEGDIKGYIKNHTKIYVKTRISELRIGEFTGKCIFLITMFEYYFQ